MLAELLFLRGFLKPPNFTLMSKCSNANLNTLRTRMTSLLMVNAARRIAINIGPGQGRVDIACAQLVHSARIDVIGRKGDVLGELPFHREHTLVHARSDKVPVDAIRGHRLSDGQLRERWSVLDIK